MVFIRFRHKLYVLGICLVVLVGFNLKPSHAQDFDSNCALFSENTIIEASSCKTTILNTTGGDEGGGGNLINYQWENGRVTVTQNVEAFFTINGKDGETVFTKDGYDLCVKNLDDQTIFCTGQVAKTTNINNLGSYQWAPASLCEANFGYAFQSNVGEDCIEKMRACLLNPINSEEECFTPELCEYWLKGKLVSTGTCVSTGLARANYGVSFWFWENGNEVSILHPIDGPSKWNKMPVKKVKNEQGFDCYHLKKTNEQFCAKSNPINTAQ